MMGSTSRASHCLSVVGEDDTVSESIELPFCDRSPYSVEGGRCAELLYFHDHRSKIVLFNSTTKELKTLPDPPEYDPEPGFSDLSACGLGYDAKSQDYKVIKIYTQFPLDEDGQTDSNNSDDFAHLYSLKSGSWKEIERPYADFYQSHGVYVGETGSCYWLATLGLGFGIPKKRQFVTMYVLSFDFATESFAHFALPDTTRKEKNFHFMLVECGGLLGAIGKAEKFPCPMENIELYVRKGQLWNRLYNVSFVDVVDGVLGIRDDELLVCDWVTKRWKKPIVYDYNTLVNVGLCLSVPSRDLQQLQADSKPKTQKMKMVRMQNCSTGGKRKRTETVLKKKTTFEITEPLD